MATIVLSMPLIRHKNTKNQNEKREICVWHLSSVIGVFLLRRRGFHHEIFLKTVAYCHTEVGYL